MYLYLCNCICICICNTIPHIHIVETSAHSRPRKTVKVLWVMPAQYPHPPLPFRFLRKPLFSLFSNPSMHIHTYIHTSICVYVSPLSCSFTVNRRRRQRLRRMQTTTFVRILSDWNFNEPTARSAPPRPLFHHWRLSIQFLMMIACWIFDKSLHNPFYFYCHPSIDDRTI